MSAPATPDGFVYEPVRGPKRKVEYEPVDDGGFERVESVWTGCAWRPVGRERLLTMQRL